MKVLIIGYGSIGKRHYSILSNIKKISSIDIVTKQKVNNITTFKSLNDIKKLELYDYFIIANETFKHYDSLKFIDKHIKNKIILVEKPLFKDYINYKPKNKVFVAYNLRFHPVIQYLKRYKFIYFNAFVGQDLTQWRERDYKDNYSTKKKQGGGVLRDLSHEIDYIQYINGNMKSIKSIVSKKSDLNIDCEDIAVSIGCTKNTILNFSLDYISKVPFRNIIAHTSNETFICDLIKNTINGKKVKSIDSNYTYKKMHKSILKNKFDKICSYEEGLNTMKTIQTIAVNN